MCGKFVKARGEFCSNACKVTNREEEHMKSLRNVAETASLKGELAIKEFEVSELNVSAAQRCEQLEIMEERKQVAYAEEVRDRHLSKLKRASRIEKFIIDETESDHAENIKAAFKHREWESKMTLQGIQQKYLPIYAHQRLQALQDGMIVLHDLVGVQTTAIAQGRPWKLEDL